MRKTYAYNGIIIGFLVGLTVYATTTDIAIGVLVGIGVSVAAFIAIRLLENALYKGARKLGDKAADTYRAHKEKKSTQSGSCGQFGFEQQTTQFPTREPGHTAAQFYARETQQRAPAAACDSMQTVQRTCPYCAKPVSQDSVFCHNCGSKIAQ